MGFLRVLMRERGLLVRAEMVILSMRCGGGFMGVCGTHV